MISKHGKPQETLAKKRSGRGAQIDPSNRFFSTYREKIDCEDWEAQEAPTEFATEVVLDHSRSILTRNKSPDIGFEFSVNAYRGCEHGCAYCFARPTHEMLGFNAGLDFETKIIVKPEAPKLLREALMKPSWTPEVIVMSGVTDCYQPLERRYKLTRACLEVLEEFRNPTSLITKNVLILRDLDILSRMAQQNLVHVNFSITTLDPDLAHKLEPRTPPPKLRLEAVRRLSEAGVPVRVLVAPIIAGLTDTEAPKILEAVAEAGATSAGYVPLRLPLAVEPIFLNWLEHHYPLRAKRVQTLIKGMHGGELYKAEFGKRMRGEGAFAEQLAMMFKIFTKRFGLDRELPDYDFTRFRRPGTWNQRELFPDFPS